MLTLPVLLLFGSLLVAADAVLERFVRDLFPFNLRSPATHAAITLALTYTTGGALRGLLPGAGFVPSLSWRPSLGLVEVGMVLGGLNALFLAFVAVQFRYFFGGDALVQALTNLTYAEYARRGFFELVLVAALLLPLLLALHWLLGRENALFRTLALALIAQLGVIMVSAVLRMLLYVEAYGLTELRLYPTAFMAWLALVFLWFAATVLVGRRERFFMGALVSALLVLAALHVLNPDAYIARVNLARAERGLPLDTEYLATLSADAVPVPLQEG